MVIHHRSFSAVGGYWPVFSVVLFFFLELSIIHATDIYVKRMLLELLNASSAQYYLKDPLCVHHQQPRKNILLLSPPTHHSMGYEISIDNNRSHPQLPMN